jgi:hypothetical protein
MSSINNSTPALYSLLNPALQGNGATNNSLKYAPPIPYVATLLPQADTPQLSQPAQVLSSLQQLQQSDPAKYQQVTQQVATNLQSAAQTAQTSGNATAATQLNQLSTDFSTASQSGQLPNVQDLAHAIGGGGHHHHHSHAASSDSDSASQAGGANANQTMNQLLTAFQPTTIQTQSVNPTSIILQTLADAGIK